MNPMLCSFNFIFPLLFTVCFLNAARHDNQTDQQALLAFKARIINDPFEVFKTWNSSTHFCQWHGVTCTRQGRPQRIIELDLADQMLTGSISPYIGNLSFLSLLNLENNSFSGQIPSEFGRLKRLKYLLLRYNAIDGKIPAQISSCTNLLVFRVSYNKLSGLIPHEFGYLSKLQYFAASKNDLVGEIPSSFGNLSSLVKFLVPLNHLSGSIPNELGKLTKLELLALGDNRFSGTIPRVIYNLSSITTLDVILNQIKDGLPSDLAITLPNLVYFSVARNQIFGSIPVSFSNASNLQELNLGRNLLSGKVPSFENSHKLLSLIIYANQLGGDLGFVSSLTNATNFEALEMHFNNFHGEWPKSFRNLSSKLTTLHLTHNQITGNIMVDVGHFVNLESLRINDNQFAGFISQDIGKLQYLQYLDLSENKFSGDIPSSIGNMSLLYNIFFNDNKLVNAIPSSLGSCKNLLVLNLAQNGLTGSIPKELCSLPSLASMDLSQNQLNGSLPSEIGNLKNLEVLNVSMNNLVGKIPSLLGSCIKLEVLALKENFLEGVIPSSFSSLRGLHIFDLSRNNLSGQIPNYLEGFRLQLLNISFNNFNGTLPEGGVFKNLTGFSAVRNPQLCGGIPELQLPKCSFTKSHKIGLNSTSKVVIFVLSSLLATSTILGCFFFLWFKRAKNVPSSHSFKDSALQNVSYQRLFQATNGFSSANVIGKGSYGSVYKGILDPEGITVAVKVLNLSQNGAYKSFKAECEALKNTRHRNLVKLLTVCSSVDHHNNEFKALVYEFMVNGSLEGWLHPIQTEDYHDDDHVKNRKLNLLERLNIAIDAAFAIDYLHNHSQTPIIHCDLKPSNILLDRELVGHVGDFGLAKFLLTDHQISDSVFRGSIGYTPPEYGIGSEISAYGDTYSYGILLLEMFTGKEPTNDMFQHGSNLHNFVKDSLPYQVAEIIDPTLLEYIENKSKCTNIPANLSQKIMECLTFILKLGVACSAFSTIERKNIKDIVSELISIRNNLLDIAVPTGFWG